MPEPNLFFGARESDDVDGDDGVDGLVARLSDVDVLSLLKELPSLLISMKFVSIGDPVVVVVEVR